MLDLEKINFIGQSSGKRKSSEPKEPVVTLETTGFKQSRSLRFNKAALKELDINTEESRPLFSFWKLEGKLGFMISDNKADHVAPAFQIGKTSQKVNCKPAYEAICKHFNLDVENIIHEGEDTGDVTLTSEVNFSFTLEVENEGKKYYSIQPVADTSNDEQADEEEAYETAKAESLIEEESPF